MRYVVLHHAGCATTRWHYRIAADGRCVVGLPESEPADQRGCVAVLIDADCTTAAPCDAQWQALQRLLCTLILRFPHIEVGGHRQLRGSNTRCPGAAFPLPSLHAWCRTALIAHRDAHVEEIISGAYGPGAPTGWR